MVVQSCIFPALHCNGFIGDIDTNLFLLIGNEENHIHFDGWQVRSKSSLRCRASFVFFLTFMIFFYLLLLLFLKVSNQCMALVRDDCLVPTLDDPSLGYVKESSSEQYVPDVFYKV